MDHFAQWRTNQGHPGKTLSINWPLWQEGGMRMNKEAERVMRKTYGMEPLDTSTGLDALRKSKHSYEHIALIVQLQL